MRGWALARRGKRIGLSHKTAALLAVGAILAVCGAGLAPADNHTQSTPADGTHATTLRIVDADSSAVRQASAAEPITVARTPLAPIGQIGRPATGPTTVRLRLGTDPDASTPAARTGTPTLAPPRTVEPGTSDVASRQARSPAKLTTKEKETNGPARKPIGPGSVQLTIREVLEEAGQVARKPSPAGFAMASHARMRVAEPEERMAPANAVIATDQGPPTFLPPLAGAVSKPIAVKSPDSKVSAGNTLARRLESTRSGPTLAPRRAAVAKSTLPEVSVPPIEKSKPALPAPAESKSDLPGSLAASLPPVSLARHVAIPSQRDVLADRKAGPSRPTLAAAKSVAAVRSAPRIAGIVEPDPATDVALAPTLELPRQRDPAPSRWVRSRRMGPAPASSRVASVEVPQFEAMPYGVLPGLPERPAASSRPVSRPPSHVAMLQAERTPAQPKSVDRRRPTAPVEQLGPFEVRGHTEELKVVLRRSKMLRTKVDIYRTSVVDPTVCDVIQFTPRELSIVGKAEGATDVTFWFNDEKHAPVTYLVRVVPDPEVQERREEQYGILEDILAELFPESKVKLVPVSDKLIVKGQARDAEEAAQILTVIRGQAVLNSHGARGYGLVQGRAANPLAQDGTGSQLPAAQVINMLRIPGVHQVALKVKIAELNRSAARAFGVDLDLNFTWADGGILIQSLLNMAGGNGAISGTFDNGDLNFGIHYLEQHGVVRMLSEPTLVTLSGRPATFIAGGEFAVPTTVGVGGAAAVTTDFRAYGAIITFLPVVLDKDHIRLEVAPEFSQIDTDNSVGGVPGLSTRAVTTTVEMREGQTLAIAGLLDDTMRGDNTGDLPFVARLLGQREVTRNETELIILVTPELIHPMEPEAVPPLPGFDVTEPTNCEFFLHGRIEGRPTHDYRSTVWPRLRRRYQAGGPAMISGPFGHGD